MIDQLMQAGDVCLLIDETWQVVQVSPQTDVGRALVGRPIWDCLRDMDPATARDQMQAAAQRGISALWRASTAMARPVTLQAFAHAAGMVLLICSDDQAPSESARLLRHAERQVRQLQRLAAGLIQTEQQERRQLAKSLHDDLQQLLAAAKLHIGIVRHHAGGQTKLQQAVDQLEQLLQNTIDASRTLAASLCPAILYEGTFAASLHWLVRHEHQRSGMTIDLQADPQAELRNDDARVMLFRVVQELLHHVHHQARSQQVRLRISPTCHDLIEIVLEDQSVALSAEQLQAWQRGDTFSLFSIGEKLKLVGGTMTIDTKAAGIRIVLHVPRMVTFNRCAQPSGPAITVRLATTPTARDNQPMDALVDQDGRAIRVMLADDHEIVRTGLASLLADQPDMEVIAMAHDGHSAVQQARLAQPDVIVMDLSMPVLSGIDATRQITAEMPHIQVIGLSMHDQKDMAIAIRKAGGWGYLRKGGPSDAVVAAIREAFAQRARADSGPLPR